MSVKNILIVLFLILISLFHSGCLKAPDTDGDGHRDPVDAFPKDPSDWKDSDGDGIGDNAENVLGTNPHNPDTDGDNYTDSKDLDPLNASMGADSDGDGYHDTIDAFPENASEWADTDGDGYGDNSDKYPEDPKYHTTKLRELSNFSITEKEFGRTTIFKNESVGTEYTFEVTNNDTTGGNFTVTVNTCNAVDWTKKECEPNTQSSGSTEIYIGAGEIKIVKVSVFSEYMKQVRTFKMWVNVTVPDVEQPV